MVVEWMQRAGTFLDSSNRQTLGARSNVAKLQGALIPSILVQIRGEDRGEMYLWNCKLIGVISATINLLL